MKYRIASLVIAILSGIIAVETFRQTVIYGMMSLVLPQWIPYAVLAAPLIGFMAEKRVFSLGYYIALTVLILIPLIQDSEVFEGMVDAIYSLGYGEISRTILGMFPYHDTFLTLTLITFLYIAGIYFENMDGIESRLKAEGFGFTLLPTPIFLALVLSAIYLKIDAILSFKTGSDFIYAIVAITVFSFSVIALWRMGR